MNTSASEDTIALNELAFDKESGLLPAIVQDAETGTVLMLGYMNREALEATLARRIVVFYSRSKQRLWEKGETSGHTLQLVTIRPDCDQDALLVSARPLGPACHLGSNSCFGGGFSFQSKVDFLEELERVILQRIFGGPERSYTFRLASSGVKRVAQKVGEEGVEVALAAVAESDCKLISEAADLIYHLLVLLASRDVRLERVVGELRGRRQTLSETAEW